MCKLLRTLLLGFLALIFSVAPTMADSIEDLSFQLEAGYRRDELDWNIGGGFTGPNIISELEWEDLEIYQIKTAGKLSIGNGAAPFDICLKGSMAYGWIVDGENQDSDFAGDNRTLEYSRSNNASDDGNVVDVSAGIGPQFKVLANRLTVTPLVGYSYHEQNLRMEDGFQTIATDGFTPPPGSFPGLDSTYDTRWRGPWTGVDLRVRPDEKFMFFGNFEYHWANFEAEADWNLRPDLAHPKSFEQDAEGEGILLALGSEYALSGNWAVQFLLNYQKWKARDGKIRFFTAEGGEGTQGLNEVNWESRAVMLGVTYRFL